VLPCLNGLVMSCPADAALRIGALQFSKSSTANLDGNTGTACDRLRKGSGQLIGKLQVQLHVLPFQRKTHVCV
jgi:hypothetical protein